MAYMSYVKVFPESETKIFHLYNKKYVSKNINGEWYTYIDGHGYKQSCYRVDYIVIMKHDGNAPCYKIFKFFKFFNSLRLAKQFARKKHVEYMKLNELFEKYEE